VYEERDVLDQLDRIDRLREEGAPAAVLLGEVRLLLSAGEAWLAEGRTAARATGGADRAALACGAAGSEPGPAQPASVSAGGGAFPEQLEEVMPPAPG
jgi:hypothetical protein